MLIRYLFCLVLPVLLSVPCMAASMKANPLHLEIPAMAKQGSAVKIKASTAGFAQNEEPVIVFSWLKKTLRAPAKLIGDRWEAKMLLPIAVDAGSNILIKASTLQASTSASLPVQKVKWPEQQISVNKKFVSPPKDVLKKIQQDREHSRKALAHVGEERLWDTFVRPVPGIITSPFGGRRMFNKELRSYHRGVDLRGATGTPIKALSAGEVALAEPMFYAGNVVYVDHGQGVISIYCHMSEIDVSPGDHVEAGQILGKVGATGRVTGPHLHLGLNILGQAVDPLSLFATGQTGD